MRFRVLDHPWPPRVLGQCFGVWSAESQVPRPLLLGTPGAKDPATAPCEVLPLKALPYLDTPYPTGDLVLFAHWAYCTEASAGGPAFRELKVGGRVGRGEKAEGHPPTPAPMNL